MGNILLNYMITFRMSWRKETHLKYPNKRKAYSLSDQILISGTAIGVLQKETECAESNADFIHNIASPQKNVTKPFSGLNCYLKQNIYPKQNIQACLQTQMN
jgi:hypothetical protein